MPSAQTHRSIARGAFSQRLEIVAMISVALVMLTAIVVTVLLRNVEVAGRPSHEPVLPGNEPVLLAEAA